MFSNKINIKKPKLESGNGDGRSISGSLGNTSFNSISPAASRRSDSRSRSLTPPVRSPPRYYQGLPLDTARVSGNNSILSEEDELYNNSKITIYKTKLNIIMQVLLQDLDKFERTYKEYKLSYDPNWSLFVITMTNEILIYINTPYESKPIQLMPEPTETPAITLPLPNSQILESLILTCTERGLIKVFSLKQINQTNDFGYSKSLIEEQLVLLDNEFTDSLIQLKDFELLLITNLRLISITLNPLNTNNLLEINYNLFNEVNISEFSIGNYNTNTEQTSILLNSTSNELIIGKLGRNGFKVNLTNTEYFQQILNKLNIGDVDCIKLEKLKLIGDQQFVILFSTKLNSIKKEKLNGSEFEFDNDEEEFGEDSQSMGESLESSYNQDSSQGGSKIKLGLAHFYQSFEGLKLLSTSFITNSERVMGSFKTSEYKLELNIMSPELAVITVNDTIVILKELTQDTIGYKSTKYEKWLGYEILPLSTLTPNNNHQLKLIAQTNSPNYSLLALNYLGKLEFNLNSKTFPSSLNFNFELEFVKFEYLKNLIQSHFKDLNNYQSPINFLKLINLQNFKIELIERVVLSIGEELFKGESLICLKTLNYQEHLLHRNFVFLEILKLFRKNRVERFSSESKSKLLNWLDLIVGALSLVKHLNPKLKLFPKSFPSKFLLSNIEKIFKQNNFNNASIKQFFTHKIDHILDLISEFSNCYIAEFNSIGGTINSSVLEVNQIILVCLIGVENFRSEWGSFFELPYNSGSWTQDDKLYEILIAQFDYSLKEYRKTKPSSEDMMDEDELNWSTVSIHSLQSQSEFQKSLLSQLRDLGRFTLDIYHHLFNRGEIGQKKVKLGQLQDVKHRVCQPLVQLGYYGLVKAFSEKLPDYKLLIDLILQCEPDPDRLLENYVDQFGEPFALELYNIYDTTGYLSKIFTQPPKHAQFVNKFLINSNNERHLWIFKLGLGEPYEVYKQLKVQAQLETCTKTKTILLRLAKYNYLEANATNKIYGKSLIRDPMDFEHDEDLVTIEDQIDLVNLINIVKAQFLECQGDFYQLLDPQLIHEMPCQLKLIENSIASIMSDKYLPPEDFIDLLMYMIPDKKELEGEHTNNGGNSALEAYRRFTNCTDDQYNYMKRTIWRRLILKDDWSKIYQDSNRGGSDVLKDKLKSTHLYQAFVCIIENKFPTNIKVSVDKILFNTTKAHLEKRFENYKGITSDFIDELIKEYEGENSRLRDWLETSELVELTNECWSLSETREYMMDDMNQLRAGEEEDVKMEE